MKRAAMLGVGLALAILGFGSATRVDAADETARTRRVGEFRPTAAKSKSQGLYGVVRKRRIGGYLYAKGDSYNGYGSSRSVYGNSQHFWDWQAGRQSRGGPFDNGYFFDSAIQTSGAQRGGDSPYMH